MTTFLILTFNTLTLVYCIVNFSKPLADFVVFIHLLTHAVTAADQWHQNVKGYYQYTVVVTTVTIGYD
jgi:hypothetical protein